MRRFATSILLTSVLAVGLVVPSAFAIEKDPTPNPSPGVVQIDPNGNTNTNNNDNKGNGDNQLPQLDTTQRSNHPLVKTDPSKNVGEMLKNARLDQAGLANGFAAAHPIVRISSYLIGWLSAIIVGTLALFNILGLFYIAIPIGFLRNIMSGGLSNSGGGSPSAPMMSGGGFNRPRPGMGAPMGSSFGGGGAVGNNSIVSKLRMVPTSAIQAVALAEQGAQGGAAMSRPPMMGGGGFGMPAQPSGGNAQPVRPIPYYLKAQAVDLVLIGISMVLLVFSSILFDTGLALGNGLAQLIQWGMSYVL